jgi:XTP/dITP diphosphohydrolase
LQDSKAGKKLVLATHNSGKIAEFEHLIAPFGVEILSAASLKLTEPLETGTTFEENAYIKAFSCASSSGLSALSDDSGLCVDALNGAPGVYTADWAINANGVRDWNYAMTKVRDAVLETKAPAPHRTRFVAVLCLCTPGGNAQYYRGEVNGSLVWPPRGTAGFGYDPIFLPDGFNRTFGEMSAEEKHSWVPWQSHALSHRARAFKLFAESELS